MQMQAGFDDAYLNNDDTFLDGSYVYPSSDDCDTSTYESFTQTESCPSVSSSFVTNDLGYLSFDDAQTESMRFMAQCSSPHDDFTTSAGSITSPVTPLGSQGSNQWHSVGPWEGSLQQNVWPQCQLSSESPWILTDDSTNGNCVLEEISEMHPPLLIPERLFSLAEYSNNVSNVALARAIFPGPNLEEVKPETDSSATWAHLSMLSHPETVEPSRTLQTMLPSSPCISMDPVTPLKYECGASALYSSSPVSKMSPSVLASQRDTDETKYFSSPVSAKYEEEEKGSHILSSSPTKCKKRSNRSSTHSARSGINCDPVIPQNSFQCSWPGCVQRRTRKLTTFMRQEHLKRHIKTVHLKEELFECWVPKCGKSFTRQDNLNSHQLKTHGCRRPNQRNKYVATLDITSEYYDKEWQGQLNEGGLPLGHPQHPEVQ